MKEKGYGLEIGHIKGKDKKMDTKDLMQLATDVNNVAAASFQSGKEHIEKPLLLKIEQLEVKLKQARKELAEKK